MTDYIKTNTNITRVRGDTFGYLQRSFLGCVSDVVLEARQRAVQYAHYGDHNGNHSGSVTIHRTGFYSVDYH